MPREGRCIKCNWRVLICWIQKFEVEIKFPNIQKSTSQYLSYPGFISYFFIIFDLNVWRDLGSKDLGIVMMYWDVLILSIQTDRAPVLIISDYTHRVSLSSDSLLIVAAHSACYTGKEQIKGKTDYTNLSEGTVHLSRGLEHWIRK